EEAAVGFRSDGNDVESLDENHQTDDARDRDQMHERPARAIPGHRHAHVVDLPMSNRAPARAAGGPERARGMPCMDALLAGLPTPCCASICERAIRRVP